MTLTTWPLKFGKLSPYNCGLRDRVYAKGCPALHVYSLSLRRGFGVWGHKLLVARGLSPASENGLHVVNEQCISQGSWQRSIPHAARNRSQRMDFRLRGNDGTMLDRRGAATRCIAAGNIHCGQRRMNVARGLVPRLRERFARGKRAMYITGVLATIYTTRRTQ